MEIPVSALPTRTRTIAESSVALATERSVPDTDSRLLSPVARRCPVLHSESSPRRRLAGRVLLTACAVKPLQLVPELCSLCRVASLMRARCAVKSTFIVQYLLNYLQHLVSECQCSAPEVAEQQVCGYDTSFKIIFLSKLVLNTSRVHFAHV